jgi:hypothetical protein
MKNEGRFFDVGNWLFWIILTIIIFLTLPYFKNGFYEERKVYDWVKLFEKHEIEQDTVSTDRDTNLNFAFWNWVDFDGQYHSIRYSFLEDAPSQCKLNRESSPGNYAIYEMMYEHDKVFLADLIKKMKAEIRRRNLSYMQALNYVCSSIQFIPYTLVVPESNGCPCEEPFGSFTANCRVQSDGRGCCDEVIPFGIYSPFEFVQKRTGDCDTRALLAFTFLKEMEFDVAVMVSDQECHSVLGVSLPSTRNGNRSLSRSRIGKPYYLWELTSPDWRLGMGVEGNDWLPALE